MKEQIDILKKIVVNMGDVLTNNIKHFEEGKCDAQTLKSYIDSSIEINIGRLNNVMNELTAKDESQIESEKESVKNNSSHVVFGNENIFCKNCGGEHTLVLPMDADKLIKLSDEFSKLHSNCKPVCKQPTVNPLLSPHEKADWWLINGERGASSNTMFQFLSGKDIGLNKMYEHPHNVDDFRHCYMLIKTIPEWKSLLNRLSPVSPVWKKLVDNWERLSIMLENNSNEEMYELMKSLTRQ